MKRIRPLMLAVMAMFVFSAVATASAQAKGTEGPSWMSEEGRVPPTETREVKAVAETPFILKNNTANVKIECKKLKFKAGSIITGSTGKNSGTGLGSTEFSGCEGGAKEGKLTGCEPVKGEVNTQETVTTLGYASPNRTGPVLVLLKPQVGNSFVTIKFTGASCFATSTAVTGQVVGEATNGVEEPVATIKIAFSETGKTIYTETEGALQSSKTSLVSFGSASTLTGTAGILLLPMTFWLIMLYNQAA